MNLSSAKAAVALNCTATATSSNVSGTVRIGAASETVNFPDADVAYSLRAIHAGSGAALALNLTTGSTTGSTTWVAGAQQVATATVVAASGITGAGNATVTVTATGMTGSPKAISVALTASTHTTATLIATAIAAGLNADADYAALFTATSSGAAVITTRKASATFTVPGGTLSLYYATIANLNVALANGTCTGITTAATSTATTAGVLSSGTKIYDSATDFEGTTLPTITKLNAVLIKNGYNAAVTTAGGNDDVFTVAARSQTAFIGADGYAPAIDTTQTLTAAGIADITVTVIGQTV